MRQKRPPKSARSGCLRPLRDTPKDSPTLFFLRWLNVANATTILLVGQEQAWQDVDRSRLPDARAFPKMGSQASVRPLRPPVGRTGVANRQGIPGSGLAKPGVPRPSAPLSEPRPSHPKRARQGCPRRRAEPHLREVTPRWMCRHPRAGQQSRHPRGEGERVDPA
jgi:hypothetical protein